MCCVAAGPPCEATPSFAESMPDPSAKPEPLDSDLATDAGGLQCFEVDVEAMVSVCLNSGHSARPVDLSAILVPPAAD